jgi:hypothetical protein
VSGPDGHVGMYIPFLSTITSACPAPTGALAIDKRRVEVGGEHGETDVSRSQHGLSMDYVS